MRGNVILGMNAIAFTLGGDDFEIFSSSLAATWNKPDGTGFADLIACWW
jgi:hypothetical protein